MTVNAKLPKVDYSKCQDLALFIMGGGNLKFV